jgi:triosephosphate isomerase
VQLRSAFDGLSWSQEKELIIAYEPVWAIGTGKSCDPTEAQRMHHLIRKIVVELLGEIKPIILYGGSVRQENIINFITMDNIDGVLVGGASAKIDSWLGIVQKVNNL